MQTVSTTPGKPAEVRKSVFEIDFEIDRNLPVWARRSSPIVKRQLGGFWRVMPVQMDSIVQWYLLQAVVILLTIPFEFLYTLILPLTLLSLGVLPFALFYYARTLYDLASDASQSMVREIEGSTLDLLLVTPMTPRFILLGKISGAIWKQSDPLAILMTIASLTQLPTLMLIYISNMENYGIWSHITLLLVFATSIIRIPLEMFMVSAMGQYIGITTSGRGTAAASTITMVLFYFALVNALRLLPLSLFTDIIVNAVLPLLLPLVIIWVLIRLSEREIID